MPNSGQLEWEPPDPNSEPDPDAVIIPRVPHDDDVSDDTDNGDDEEEEEED